MGFKLPGKSIQSGTSAHSSALKMKAKENAASALKHWSHPDPDADHSVADHAKENIIDPIVKKGKEIFGGKSEDKKAYGGTKTWEEGSKASGGTLNDLVKARKGHEKGTPGYAEIQNKINKHLGSKVEHKVTKKDKKGNEVEVTPKGTKETTITKDDGSTVTENRQKGIGRKNDKTLSYTDKQVEKVRIDKEKEDIKDAKESGNKVEKTESQKTISEIKSGRDNEKTGTVVSRLWHKGRAKRKAKKEARLREKEETPVKIYSKKGDKSKY